MAKKILVMSDSHGVNENVKKALDLEKPDMLIHCGDVEHGWDEIRLWAGVPLVPVIFVRGNCDWSLAKNVQEMAEFEMYGHKIMVVHGHRHSAERGVGIISYQAAQDGCDIVFYGHTHVPCDIDDRGIRIMNPGSISLPRGGSAQGYIIVMMEDDGKYTAEWKKLL